MDFELSAHLTRERARNGSTNPHSCRCGTRWLAPNAHCSHLNCHYTFFSVRGLDVHRRGGTCREPSEVGMIRVPGRAYECWGYPGEVTE